MYTIRAAVILAVLLTGCVTEVKFDFDPDRVTAQWPDERPDRPPGELLIVSFPGQSALLGRHQVSRKTVTFIPAFPLLAGERYQAQVPGQSPVLFSIPSVDAPAPRLTGIHPTTDVLPANHLKFYLHFSESMEQGNIFRHFKLSDDSGQAVPEPFRETELWSADEKRLTLWLHPGRQKTGVNLNRDLGPVLNPGQTYTLTISGRWKSQAGKPLGANHTKTFRALPPDRTQPDPAQWQLVPPPANTRTPLILQLNEPLDWALLQNQITVENIPGQTQVTRAEREWRFVPDAPWPPGEHRLLIGWELEDLAGNNLERPFEVDLQNAPPHGLAQPRRVQFFVK